MKTLDQVLASYISRCLDGRDFVRLVEFVPAERLMELGLRLKDPDNHVPKPFTKEAVLEQLKDDVAFGFEKALNKRGISSALMYEVVRMWNWILEDGLEELDDYRNYGLPVLKATALKYGFDNPIGDDLGSEEKYNE